MSDAAFSGFGHCSASFGLPAGLSTFGKDFSVSDYLRLGGIGIGFPIAVLGVGFAIGWAIAGFRSN